MEKKVNLVKLLKNCPEGMELDCTMYDNLYFKCIRGHAIYPIVCYTVDSKGEKHETSFNWYGKHTPIDTAKCAIFPKGKTTWEGFVPPIKFKDGDILFVKSVYNWIIIYKESEDEEKLHKYVAISDHPNSTYMVYDKNPLSSLCYKEEISKIRFATEEEKDKLFNVIKDKGYRWNGETKTLEELAEPKFKDGDILYCDANDYGENDDDFKYIFIFDKLEDGQYYYSHCHLGGSEFYDEKTFLVNDYPVRFATEEEKQKLFQAIKDNGYTWNAETKTLEELAEPKFKPGDVLVSESGNLVLLSHIDSENIVHYHCIIPTYGSFRIEENTAVGVGKCYDCVLANEQQRQRMYDKIKSSGYEYNQSTNKLEKVDESEFKDGDIVFSGNGLISIFKELKPSKNLHSYVSIMHNGCLYVDGDIWTSDNMRLATEGEKEMLFNAMSYEGYKWDPDTKTLLTVPVFKPGDRIKRKDAPAVHTIKMIDTDLYVFDDLQSIPIIFQGDYELVTKFDITALKPFDRVMVRNYDSDEWRVALWGHFKEKHDVRYDTTRGTYRRCIPYEGNEHLLGEYVDCDDYYKTW